MHLRNQPPVFVPSIYRSEIEKFSKATLMDMVWDLAQQLSSAPDDRPRQTMEQVQKTAEIVTLYRKQAKASDTP